MSELQEQLAALRARMARVLEECADKYERPKNGRIGGFSDESAVMGLLEGLGERRAVHGHDAKRTLDSEGFHVNEWLPGAEVETERGHHYETETLYARHRRHGSADISALAELPADLLETLSNGAIQGVPPQEWAFLDTETTGLAGGTGTCAFLIGVGRITPEGFRVRQFFMRDYGEEASVLDALTRHLEPFRVLITYNGRTFDQPLLETRYRMNRAQPPFSQFEHLDLLHGARRLWKLRFESCRLVDLETQVLGFERQGDVPGALIPYIYFEYVRTQEIARLVPVFHHNAMDILTLACLTGIVPYAFREGTEATDAEGGPGVRFKNGAELAAISRWLREAGDPNQARVLMRRAIDAGLRDELLFRSLWDLAALERKLGADDAALAVWNDLAGAKNPYQVKACEELAKHYEHRAKDWPRALEMTRAALDLSETAELRKREERVLRRLASEAREPAKKGRGAGKSKGGPRKAKTDGSRRTAKRETAGSTSL